MKKTITSLFKIFSFAFCALVYDEFALGNVKTQAEALQEEDFLFRATSFLVERSKTSSRMASLLQMNMTAQKVNDPFKLNQQSILSEFLGSGGKLEQLPCYPGEPSSAVSKRFFACFEPPKSNAKQKAWLFEDDFTKYIYEDGDIELFDQKWALKLQRPNALNNVIMVSMLPTPALSAYAFRATTGAFPNNNVSAVFNGQCSSLVRVDVILQGAPIDGFESSKKLDELPIKPSLDAMKLALKDQCADLEGFQLYVTSQQAAKTRMGSMLAENDWKITDGVAVSKNENQLVVNLKLVSSTTTAPSWSSSGSTLGTIYTGKCAVNAVLPFEQFKGHYLDTLNPDDFSIDNYVENAHRIAKIYALQCPSTESITFDVKAVLPNRYQCIDATKCMVLTKAEGWKADTSQMQQLPPPVEVVRVKDCKQSDMFCDLPAGDYLNAIYEGNIDKIRDIDAEMTATLRRGLLEVPGVGDVGRLSVIARVVNEYTYYYKSFSRSCLRSGAQSLTFEKHVNGWEMVDGRGIVLQHYNGWDLRSVYVVNEEFIAITAKVGAAQGPANELSMIADRLFNKGMLSDVAQGVQEMMQSHDCDSPEIRQFEKNLLRLFPLVDTTH